jgi:transposase
MQTLLDIGVDVAKDWLEIAYAGPDRPGERLANTPEAIRSWLAGLPRGSRLGVEATGCYHEPLARMAHRAGLAVFVLNPKDTRHYARGVGTRTKTDRVDALLLARLVAREHDRLHPATPATPSQQALGRLLRRRHTLTTVKGSLRQSLTGLTGFAGDLQALLARLDTLIVRIDQRIATLIAADPERRAQHTRLQAIDGVGATVGAGLTQALERIPFKTADAFVAYTGLDPRPCDSGQHRGRRRLTKRGPAELRRLLFLAAMAAAKTRAWRPLYQHYRDRGWPTTAALVILARKIARIAWSLYHHQSTYDPARLQQGLT